VRHLIRTEITHPKHPTKKAPAALGAFLEIFMENKNFKWVITGHKNGHEIGKYVFIPPWEREDKPSHKSPPSTNNYPLSIIIYIY
jgi:hypothetical protein